MFTIKVELYRSLEYSMKWKDPMNPIRKSKRLEKFQNHAYVEDPIERKAGGRRLENGWGKKTQSENRKNRAVEKECADDIIDIINRSQESEPEERVTVEVADEGVEQSDDDTNSIRSGPSSPKQLPTEKTAAKLCPACRTLYQRVRRMKAPLKDKLLDNNPKSLTCDQWILLKPWCSKTPPDSRGNVSHFLKMVKKGKKKYHVRTEEVCSRPHLFLTRNLRRCVRKPQKKKNRRKRPCEDSQDSRVAKQQRLLNDHRQPISNDLSLVQPLTNGIAHSPDLTYSSGSSLESSDLTLRPESVTAETDSSKVNTKSVSKKGGGFRDLLAQLRGNHSMIIRESEVTPHKHTPFTGWKRS